MAADEIMVGPATVYLAPVGTAFPDVDTAPAGTWHLVGTLGAKNLTEDGVTIRTPVESEDIGALGTTLIRKVAISRRGFEAEFTVMDMSPEEMLLAMGGDPEDITDTAAGSGTPGTQKFALPTTPVVLERAVLIRFPSPIDPALAAQIQIQAAVQKGSGEGLFHKTTPFGQTHIWAAIEPDSGEAVEFVYQDAVAGV